MIYTTNRRHLHSRATHEDFVSRIEFSSINTPLLYLHTKFISYYINQCIACNTLKNIFGQRRCAELPIAQQEDVARTCLRNSAIMSEQDSFIKSGCCGIIYCQGAIDISSGNFCSYRHSITVGPPPGCSADTQPRAYI